MTQIPVVSKQTQSFRKEERYRDDHPIADGDAVCMHASTHEWFPGS